MRGADGHPAAQLIWRRFAKGGAAQGNTAE
jgi:hypothetical protein